MPTKSLGSLTIDLLAKTGAFEQGMDKADRKVKKQVRELKRDVKELGTQVDTMFKHFAIGGAAVVGAFGAATAALVIFDHQMHTLVQLSQGLGVSIKQFTSLAAVLDDYGDNAQATAVLVATLERNTKQAAQGSKTMATAFHQLGINAKQATDPMQTLLAISAHLHAQGKVNAQDAAALTTLFGSQAKTLGALLVKGPQYIKSQFQQAQASGQAFGKASAAAAMRVYNAFDSIGDALDGLKNKLVVGLEPSIIKMSAEFGAWLQAFEANGGIHKIAVGMEVVAKVAVSLLSHIKAITEAVAAFFALTVAVRIATITATLIDMGKALKAIAASEALADMLNPITALITLSGALAAGFAYLATRESDAHKTASKLASANQNLAKAIDAVNHANDTTLNTARQRLQAKHDDAAATLKQASAQLKLAQANLKANTGVPQLTGMGALMETQARSKAQASIKALQDKITNAKAQLAVSNYKLATSVAPYGIGYQPKGKTTTTTPPTVIPLPKATPAKPDNDHFVNSVFKAAGRQQMPGPDQLIPKTNALTGRMSRMGGFGGAQAETQMRIATVNALYARIRAITLKDTQATETQKTKVMVAAAAARNKTLARINEEYQQAQLHAMASMFGGFAQLAQAFTDGQQKRNSAAFKIMKGFELAQASIKMFGAMMQALDTPFPEDLIAIGTVAAAAGHIIGLIKGTDYGGGKATGGPVMSGTTYMVGERGPELFTPHASGSITPNDKLGGGVTEVVLNITNNGQPMTGRQTSSRRQGNKLMVDFVLNTVAGDMAAGGRTAQATSQRFGVQARGQRLLGR